MTKHGTVEHFQAFDVHTLHRKGAFKEELQELPWVGTLNQSVTERIKIAVQRRAQTLAVRKLHDDLLEVITLAVDDANFALMNKSQTSQDRMGLSWSIDSLRHLLELQAESNLLVGLLIESSLVVDKANLPPLRDLIAAAKRHIETNLKALPDPDQAKKISALYQRLALWPATVALSHCAVMSSIVFATPSSPSPPRLPMRRD